MSKKKIIKQSPYRKSITAVLTLVFGVVLVLFANSAVMAEACFSSSGDVNCDGLVNDSDVNELREAWGESALMLNNDRIDINKDGIIGAADLSIVTQQRELSE